MIFKSSVPKNKAAAYLAAFKSMLDDAMLQPEMAEKFHFAVVQTHGIRHAIGEPASMLDSVAIGFRQEGAILVSLFTPHSPWMSSTPDFPAAIASTSISHQDHLNMLKAFELPEETKVHVIGHMYEPIEKNSEDLQYIQDVTSTLVSRLFMEAALDEMAKGDLPVAESPIIPLTAPQGRALEFDVEFRQGDGASKNIMGLPVRDDFILTLTCTDQALLQREMSANTRRGMGKPKVYFLEVLGYVDFRLVEPAHSARPWAQPQEQYVPEFIITAIRTVDDANIADGSISAPGLHDIQATCLSTMMATQFMRSGAWTKRFSAALGSNMPMDFLNLVPKEVGESYSQVRGNENELVRMFNQTLAEGFVVSLDVDDNALDQYSMHPIKNALQHPQYFEKCLVPVMYHSFAAYNSFNQPKYLGDYDYASRCHIVKRSGVFLDKGSYSRVSFGRISMQRQSDIRYIDALAAYNLTPKDRDQATRYMDAFYPSAGMRMAGAVMFDHNYKTRRAFQQEQTDVVYTGVAERISVEPLFIDEMLRLLRNNGGSMTVITGQTKRPTVGHDSLNAF